MMRKLLLNAGFVVAFVGLFWELASSAGTNPFYPNYVGQCTWWAAEKRPDLWPYVRGHAFKWVNEVPNDKYIIDTTPEVGAVAVWGAGIAGTDTTSGHVAYVISVSDKTNFRVSECNWGGKPCPSERDVIWVSGIQYIHTLGYSPGGPPSKIPPTPDPFVSYTVALNPTRATIGETVRITVSAQDTNGYRTVSSIQIKVNGSSIGTITGNAGSFDWNTKNYLSGTHTIRFEARLANWNGSVNAREIIYNLSEVSHPPAADTTKPDGDYISPSNGDTVSCIVKLSAWANDNQSGVKKVHFTAKWNNQWSLIATDTSSPYEYNWNVCDAGVPNGDIELGLDVYDNAGNEFNLSKKHANPHITKNAQVTATTTPKKAPVAPAMREPTNNAKLANNTDIWFSWYPSEGASQYYLEYWGGDYGTLNSRWIYDTAYHIGAMWPGSYSWHVKARNASGMESNWSQTWDFTVREAIVPTTQVPPPVSDKTKPDGDYTSPSNGAIVGCTVYLAAWASDNQSGVKEVHFTAKWNNKWSLVHNDTSAPYEYEWNLCASNVPNGDIELGLDIFDQSGNEFNLNTKHTNIHITKISATPTVPQPPPSTIGNIAPKANRNPDGIGSASAFDGNISTYWTDGLGHGFTLKLSWGDILPVTRIIVWDRPQNSPDNNQINALIISLGNGVRKRFGMDSMNARCIDVKFSSPQNINSITLQADDASGNNGLSEVEIWVGSKTSGISCSNSGIMP